VRFIYIIFKECSSHLEENIQPTYKYCTYLLKANVGFEVLTAVVMRSSVFWDITPRSRWKSTDVSEEHVAFIFRVEE
jgi:hypothetical protein